MLTWILNAKELVILVLMDNKSNNTCRKSIHINNKTNKQVSVWWRSYIVEKCRHNRTTEVFANELFVQIQMEFFASIWDAHASSENTNFNEHSQSRVGVLLQYI